MNPSIDDLISLLLLFLAYALCGCWREPFGTSPLTECGHCGGAGKHECFECVKAFMGERSYVHETTFPCRECQRRDGDKGCAE